MRRLLLLCLLLALPLQGPWAAVDGGCCRGQPCPEAVVSLLAQADADDAGHTMAPHHAAGDSALPCGGDSGERGTTSCDAGCPHCQGSGAAALPTLPAPLGAAPADSHPPAAAVTLPDPLPEHLLRPPRA